MLWYSLGFCVLCFGVFCFCLFPLFGFLFCLRVINLFFISLCNHLFPSRCRAQCVCYAQLLFMSWLSPILLILCVIPALLYITFVAILSWWPYCWVLDMAIVSFIVVMTDVLVIQHDAQAGGTCGWPGAGSQMHGQDRKSSRAGSEEPWGGQVLVVGLGGPREPCQHVLECQPKWANSMASPTVPN